MPSVEATRDGAVMTIALNRPDVLNALDAATHRELLAALHAARDPAVRAVVLTGVGRGFCVGQDLQEFSAGAGDVARSLRERFHPNVLAIRALEKPVIAAVNGPAAGAGMSLALACDVRIAAASASFVPAFVKIGLAPDTGGTWLARRLLGTARAFEWLTTGRKLGAEEARSLGLVSEVVPDAELAERAQEVAQLYAAMPTRAVWETKRLLDAAETSTFAEQLEHEATAQAELTRTHDFAEGVAAFLAKREAAFDGADSRTHPVTLSNRDDGRRWRLTVFLRPVLAFPHLAVSTVWGLVAIPVAIVSWFVTLARGRTPDRVHDWLARSLRYTTHVTAYSYALADPFPRFRGEPEDYPVDLRVAPAAPQARWRVALRLPLAIPAAVLAYAFTVVLQVVGLLCLVCGLVAGRAPRGVQELGAYCLRYRMQTLAYLLLLTERYPSLASGTD
jgi:2-(1,2-epoxy-1,2-dihydrophenyl)acetyl-CoA isomerase